MFLTATDVEWPTEIDLDDEEEDDNANIKVSTYDSELTADATPLMSDNPPSTSPSRAEVLKNVLPNKTYEPPTAPRNQQTIEQVNLTVEASTQNDMHYDAHSEVVLVAELGATAATRAHR